MEKEENVYEGISPTEEFAEAKENGALTVLGKFKDVSALVRAYESLQAEFTRRSQRLRQLEKASENFKQEETSSGAEKLRKAAKAKRLERKECDAFKRGELQSGIKPLLFVYGSTVRACWRPFGERWLQYRKPDGFAKRRRVKEKEIQCAVSLFFVSWRRLCMVRGQVGAELLKIKNARKPSV